MFHVISPYVGGEFGSKGKAHPPVILAVMAAQIVGRPVKFALARQHMFAVAGYRTPTIQHVRLGADSEGRLTAIEHESLQQSRSCSVPAGGSGTLRLVSTQSPAPAIC